MKNISNLVVTAGLLVLVCFPVWAQDKAIYSQLAVVHPVKGKTGMVSTQEARATQIGLDILKGEVMR